MGKQKTFILWLTGLSASGKTTVGTAIYKELKNKNYKIHYLDGDEVRASAKKKLGFTKEDRNKNISLVIDLARNYQEKGFMLIASFISPCKIHREWGRNKLENYIEVFIDAPLNICETRDPKGMYKKARAGEIKSFTGISDKYEIPKNPDIHLKTDQMSVDECVKKVKDYLRDNNYID